MDSSAAAPEKNISTFRWYHCPETWFFIAVTLTGLLLRLEYLREYAAEPHFAMALGADISEYYERAQEILSGKIFPETPEIHAPLYSFFLALLCKIFRNSIPAIRSCQLLLNFGAWLVFYFLLKKRRAPAAVYRGFLLFAMLLPSTFFHQAELVSETLLLPLLAIFFYLDFRQQQHHSPWLAAAGGAVSALLTLTHGLMLCFSTAFMVWLLCRRKFRHCAFFAGAFLLLTGTVIAAKSAEYGKFTGIQANSFFNIFLGNNPDATGGCYLRPDRSWKQFHRQAQEEMQQRNIGEARLYLGRIADFYCKSPGKALTLTAKKALRLFAPWEYIAGSDPNSLIMATTIQRCGRAVAVVLVLFVLCGMYRVIRDKIWEYSDFYILGGALALGQILTVTAGRYRQGMIPAAVLLAALGAAAFPWKKCFCTITLFCAAAVLTAIFPLHGNDAEAAGIRGEALLKQGKYQQAEPLLLYAAAQIDHPARFCNMLGDIAENRQEWQEAWQLYSRAVKEETPC